MYIFIMCMCIYIYTLYTMMVLLGVNDSHISLKPQFHNLDPWQGHDSALLTSVRNTKQ
jgi:hypothetical protein